MKIRFSLLQVLLVVSFSSQAQQTAEKYASTITADELKKNLEVIASDALEGRQTGSTGEKMAATFVASKFEQAGLQSLTGDNYFQPFKLYSVATNDVYIKSPKTLFPNYGSIVFFGVSGTNGELVSDLVFAGSGTEEELGVLNIRDKAVLLWLDTLDSGIIGKAASSLQSSGAKVILIYSPKGTGDFAAFSKQMSQLFSAGNVSLQPLAAPDAPLLFFVDRPVVDAFFGNPDKLKKRMKNGAAVSKVKSSSITVRVDAHSEIIKTQNVAGFLEGSDLKNEVIVITAHHDHIGLTTSGNDKVNNGADDDGSGTVTVIQVARAFAKAKSEGHGPRRSILFMTVSAEEQGLYGSQWYTDFNPIVPLSSTIANLNIDMIGRIDEEHKDKNDYVYVVGSDRISKELHEVSERANSSYTKLDFDYTYNDEHHPTNIYKRSDHWNFAKHGIPIIFYFDGIHEDYHKPSDEVSKINFKLLTKRAQCVFYTAWELANRDQRVKQD
jgi:hypothetical protein